MLSDIEESVEVSTKKSYKLRSPSVHATFVVGGEAKDTGTVSTRTASRSIYFEVSFYFLLHFE